MCIRKTIQVVIFSVLFVFTLALIPVLEKKGTAWSEVQAAPLISSVNGTIAVGEIMSIRGSDFGANGPNIVLYDNFEGGSNGETVETGSDSATIGGWASQSAGGLITYSNAHTVSGSLAARFDMSSQENQENLNILIGGENDIFLSWWVYLPAEDYWPGEDHPLGANWKMIWYLEDLSAPFNGSDIIIPERLSGNKWQVAGNHDCHVDPNDTGNPNEPRINLGMEKGKWKRSWVWMRARSDDTGEINYWHLTSSGVELAYQHINAQIHCNSGVDFAQVVINAYGRASSSSHPTYDDVYLATGPNAQARVEIGNAPTYNASTNLAILTPTSWSDTSITSIVRQGSFKPGDTAYLYVVDANGNAGQAYPITIGEGSNSPPNNQPITISNIQHNSVTAQSATITWNTNTNGNSKVDYGTTSTLGSSESDSNLTTSHSISMSSLQEDTMYYYKVTSCDSSDSCLTQGPYQFNTLSVVPLSDPGIPYISGTTGTFNNRETVTITGSGFDSKSQAAPIKYDDFESGTVGRSVEEGGWDVVSSADTPLYPEYSNGQAHSGTKSAVTLFKGGNNTDNGDSSNFGLRKRFPMPKIYMDAWVYFPNDPPYGRNYKMFRIQPMEYFLNNDFSQGKNGNLYLQLFCDSYDHIILEQDGVTDGIPGPGADIWKYLYNYDTSYFEKKWTHIQLYVEESSMGVADGTAVLWIDGIREVDREGKWKTREEGSSYWATIWFGNYYSTIEADGCSQYNIDPKVFFDNVYVDSTRSRVEIGANPKYDSTGTRHHREIQIPTSWSDSSITVDVNQGSFNEGDTVYLYVINASGNVNDDGYPITIGSGSQTPVPPSPPKSLRIF